jgi:hypothetical protein
MQTIHVPRFKIFSKGGYIGEYIPPPQENISQANVKGKINVKGAKMKPKRVHE